MIGREFLQAGSFNLRLSVQTPVENDDGYGGSERIWEHGFFAWVRLIPVRNVLVQSAQGEREEISHWIILRQRPDLTRHMRFASPNGQNARIFEIDTIHDPDETGRYLLCEVREIE